MLWLKSYLLQVYDVNPYLSYISISVYLYLEWLFLLAFGEQSGRKHCVYISDFIGKIYSFFLLTISKMHVDLNIASKSSYRFSLRRHYFLRTCAICLYTNHLAVCYIALLIIMWIHARTHVSKRKLEKPQTLLYLNCCLRNGRWNWRSVSSLFCSLR